MSNENLFSTLDTGTAEAAPAVTTTEKSAADAAKRKKFDLMRNELRATMNADPTFATKLHSLSGDIKVINSLGFGASGNIVVDKKAAERQLVATSLIVGYRIQNTGKTPVKYMTEKWTAGPDGKFVAQKIEKNLAPGGTADLNRQHMTMFCAIPEISFHLANGKIIRSSAQSKGVMDTKAELEAHYFAFSRGGEGTTAIEINSDEIKLNVGQKDAAGAWKVKPEFLDTFGYLNNPKEGAAKTAKTSDGLTAQDIAANWVRKMLNESPAI